MGGVETGIGTEVGGIVGGVETGIGTEVGGIDDGGAET